MAVNLIKQNVCRICMQHSPKCFYYLDNILKDDTTLLQGLISIYPETLINENLPDEICDECYHVLIKMYKVRHTIFMLPASETRRCHLCSDSDCKKSFKVASWKQNFSIKFFERRKKLFTLHFAEYVIFSATLSPSFNICDECFESLLVFHSQHCQAMEYWADMLKQPPHFSRDSSDDFMEDDSNGSVQIVKVLRKPDDIYLNFQLEYVRNEDKTAVVKSNYPFICNVCKLAFKDYESQKKHGCTVKRYVCFYCMKECQFQCLKIHYKEHNLECNHCAETFHSKSILLDHLKIHQSPNNESNANKRNEFLSCPVCNKSSKLKVGLINHIRSHKDYHFCKRCLVGFFKKQDFEVHLKNHSKFN